jgi:uncharacterized paraquat-inducible protein A
MPSSTGPEEAKPPADGDDVEHLLAFLRDRDVACPLCGYNMRNLTRPQCPECRQTLELTVGAQRVRLGPLVALLAPSIFSGIAAVLLALPIVIVPLVEGSRPPWTIVALDGFGWLSGVAGLILWKCRGRILAAPVARQLVYVVASWLMHLAALGVVVWALIL